MSKLLGLILPIVVIVMGVQLTRDYFGDTTKEQKSNLEDLIANGVDATATLSNEYKTKKIKIAKVPIKMYEFNYTFNVEGKIYTGTKTYTAEMPSSSTVNVKYLASNPSSNAIEPEAELVSLEESGGTTTLMIGMVLMLGGAFLGYKRLKSFQQA